MNARPLTKFERWVEYTVGGGTSNAINWVAAERSEYRDEITPLLQALVDVRKQALAEIARLNRKYEPREAKA